jgi:hypothetical protein
MQYILLLLSCQGFLLGKITWEEGMLLAHYQLPFEELNRYAVETKAGAKHGFF